MKNYLKALFDPRLNRSGLAEDEAGGLSQWAERKRKKKVAQKLSSVFKRRPRFSGRDCVSAGRKARVRFDTADPAVNVSLCSLNRSRELIPS